MTDLLNRLARLDGSAPAPGEDVVAGDLARASTAQARRRRTAGAVAGVGLTLALGGGLGIAAVVGSEDTTAPPVTRPADPGEKEATTIDLVAYEGEQPEGFEVAVVPEGFFAQGSDPYVFTVAREGDTSDPLGFEDKLVVMLESKSKAPGDIEGDPVTVGGKPGGIRSSPEAVTLEYQDGDFDVVVQMWRSVGLTDDQLIEFAKGVTVTDDAQAGVG
jgi:hypothetical protein